MPHRIVVIVLPFVVIATVTGLVVRWWIPRTVTHIERVVERAPGAVIERVLTDTVRTVRWRDRIVEKITTRTVLPETVAVYRERVSPRKLKVLLSDVERRGNRLTVIGYTLADSTLRRESYHTGPEFRVSVDQRTGRIVVRERRNWTDLRPRGEVGWLTTGPYAAAWIRLGPLYPTARVDEERAAAGVAWRF